MFKNNLKIAWRNLVKDRQFALLNLLGLATGLACTFLIYLWVSSELSVNDFHNKNLYQVMQNIPQNEGEVLTLGATPDNLAKALTDEMPEIKEAVIIKAPDVDDNPQGIVSVNSSGIKAGELYVTPNFFNVFSCRLIKGDNNKPFPNTESVILSSAMANRLFNGTENIIGKTIKWDRGAGQAQPLTGTYVVAGVFETPPANSSMQFDLVFPNALYAEKIKHHINWLSSSEATYVVLKYGANWQTVNAKIKDFIKNKFKAGDDGLKWAGTLFLQRYTDEYLYNHYEHGAAAGGRIDYVKLFSIIAAFILVIACINFMNLSTAKASKRAKEVGIKKVVGASRKTLIYQYLSESVLMTLLAVMLAIIMVYTILPQFQVITGKQLTPTFNAQLAACVLLITLVTGLVSGSYPALYLSGFKPVAVLKGRIITSAGESVIRKGLVVFQFAISVILIVSVVVVYRQMKLVQTKNLGYNKDHIIHFANDGKLQQNQQAFLRDVKATGGVVNASDMEGDMLGNHSGGGGLDWEGKTHRIEFSGLYVDYNFMETMQLKMHSGRPFSPSFVSDTDGVIFNETAIAAMGLKNPIGKIVKMWGKPQKIIGVVKDFHFESLYKTMSPFFLSYRKNASNIMVKIQAGTEKETIAKLEALYKKYNPGLPFEYKFLDDDYQALYASEQRVATLSGYFAGMAVIISCLGLFGLAAFTAQKRQKEIGIRKIIGATVANVVAILSIDFLKLIIIAVIIAFPIAWWAANQWLNSFAYRVTISTDIFIIAGTATLLITIITISYQAIKAAVMNPVRSLRSE